MKVLTKNFIKIEDCLSNPKTLYLFGDNLLRKGKKGQAQIRDCVNSFGIATKHLPSMSPEAFFEDSPECLEYIHKDFKKLKEVLGIGKYDTVVIPANGIGTGLAKLPEKAPKVFALLNRYLQDLAKAFKNWFILRGERYTRWKVITHFNGIGQTYRCNH